MGKPGYWTAMLPSVGSAIDVLSWHAYPGYGLGGFRSCVGACLLGQRLSFGGARWHT